MIDLKTAFKKEIAPSVRQGRQYTTDTTRKLRPPVNVKDLTLQHLNKAGNFQTVDVNASLFSPKELVTAY